MKIYLKNLLLFLYYRQQLAKSKNAENIITPLDDVILIPTKSSYKFTNHIDQLLPELCEDQYRNTKIYISTIEKVYNNSVCFAYMQGNISDEESYDVLFRPSRLVLKYQYRALELLGRKTLSILFPKPLENILETKNPKYFYDL